MSNGDLHAREREDLSLHVERCAERYGAVQSELGNLRQQMRRIETAIWAMAALLLALGAGSAQVLPLLRALAQVRDQPGTNRRHREPPEPSAAPGPPICPNTTSLPNQRGTNRTRLSATAATALAE